MDYNLAQIFVCNAMGIILMIGILAKSVWNTRVRDEGRYLLIMSFITMVSCLFESAAFFVDGKANMVFYVLNYIYNSWLYLANVTVCSVWELLIIKYLGTGNEKLTKKIISVFHVAGLIGLIINIFHPFLFYIDKATNTYSRGPQATLYSTVSAAFLFIGIGFYLANRNKKSSFKSLPILQSVVPPLVAAVIQVLQYGTSIAWAGTAVGIMILAISLQMDNIYIDKLTGIFNRFYIDKFESSIGKQKRFCLLMIDMNDFKRINDELGHPDGDRALCDMADILVKTVKDQGTVIRFAGDEFLVIYDSDDPAEVESFIGLINIRLERFNAEQGRPYKLSISAGYEIFSLKEHSINEALENADKEMYKQKETFYAAHDRRGI